MADIVQILPQNDPPKSTVLPGGFLQSPEWELFQKEAGRKTWRVDGVLVIQHVLPLGFNYLYCPRPDSGIMSHESGINVLEKIKVIAFEEKSIFLKIDPVANFQFSIFNFQKSNSLQPRRSLLLDLTQSTEELLRAMHEKTRYNVKLAERKGVSIAKGDPGIFIKLLKETAKRDGFHLHPESYYQKLLDTQTSTLTNELFIAVYQNEPIAGAMINFYSPTGTATYLHGASTSAHRNVMAPYFLHWYVIQEAKNRGFHAYDFWGIDETHWPGVTRFKKGFGGEIIEYPLSLDILYKPFWYKLYRAIKKKSA